LARYSYPLELEVDDIWSYISDFWSDFQDKDKIRTFWQAYSILFDKHIGETAFNTLFMQSLENFDVTPEQEWYLFEKDNTGALTNQFTEVGLDVYKINILQDRKDDPTHTFVCGTDFQLEKINGKQYITGNILQDFDYLWAPKVEFNLAEWLYNNIGNLIPFDYTLFSPDQYKIFLQSVFWYQIKGPTLDNLAKVVAAMVGLVQAKYAGSVISVESSDLDRVIIVADDNYKDTYEMESGTCAVSVGDTVTRFQSLQSGITVEDFVSNPTWYTSYKIGPAAARNFVHILIDNTVSVNDTISFPKIYEFLKSILPVRVNVVMSIPFSSSYIAEWDSVVTNQGVNSEMQSIQGSQPA